VRAYRRGDPLKLVVWKKAAKADELVSRDTQQAQGWSCGWTWPTPDCRCAWPAAATPNTQLSRLCAWVLQADKLGLDYGLRLPGARSRRPAARHTADAAWKRWRCC
jgi:hypothetical protein